MVSSLKGTGVKPAIARRVIQAIIPPSDETLSFKKVKVALLSPSPRLACRDHRQYFLEAPRPR